MSRNLFLAALVAAVVGVIAIPGSVFAAPPVNVAAPAAEPITDLLILGANADVDNSLCLALRGLKEADVATFFTSGKVSERHKGVPGSGQADAWLLIEGGVASAITGKASDDIVVGNLGCYAVTNEKPGIARLEMFAKPGTELIIQEVYLHGPGELRIIFAPPTDKDRQGYRDWLLQQQITAIGKTLEALAETGMANKAEILAKMEDARAALDKQIAELRQEVRDNAVSKIAAVKP